MGRIKMVRFITKVKKRMNGMICNRGVARTWENIHHRANKSFIKPRFAVMHEYWRIGCHRQTNIFISLQARESWGNDRWKCNQDESHVLTKVSTKLSQTNVHEQSSPAFIKLFIYLFIPLNEYTPLNRCI